MTRRTLLALPLVQPLASAARANTRPPLSLQELKAAFLALPLNDRVAFALWSDNCHRVLSGKDDGVFISAEPLTDADIQRAKELAKGL